MATLTGTTIADTYDSLLHVEDNTAGLVATSTDSRVIQDGVGANSALALATDSIRITSTNKLYFNDVGGEYISGNGTALTLNSGEDINLTCATGDVNIPVNIGLRFGDGNQHIETDNTDLTITSDVSINLSAPQVDLLVDTNFVTTGGVNGMSIDGTTFSVDGANNRVGIGTASPDNPLEVVGGFKCGSTSATSGFNDHAIILCDSGTAYEGGLLITQQDTAAADTSSAKFNVTSSAASGTADMTIGVVDNEAPNTYIRKWFYLDGATGNVGINTIGTPLATLHVYAEDTEPLVIFESDDNDVDSGDIILKLDFSDDTNIHGVTARFISFHDQGGEIGYITTAADGSVNAITTSDIRLKKDIVDTSINGLSIINALKIRDFTWNDKAGEALEGLEVKAQYIADEVYEVYPLATTGTPGSMKDILDDDGNKTGEEIDRMGVGETRLISVLIKSVQELSASNDALKARIEVLEAA